MRFKKIIAVVCAAAVVMSLAGCSMLDSENNNSNSNRASSVVPSSSYQIVSSPNSPQAGDTYKVEIHINFVSNMIFSKYDVDLSVDGVMRETLKHGTDADIELDLSAGEHTIMFTNHDDSSVSGSASLYVDDDMKATYTISCHYDGVDIEEETPTFSHESDSSGIQQPPSGVEVNFPVENARRAAVVALTNGYATDVFTEDGDYYDPVKLHTYADLSGYYMTVLNEGIWTAKSENTWHVEGLILEDSLFKNKTNAALDITFDGTNYIASNLKGIFGTNNDLASLETEPDHFKNNYLVVKPEMIADDREKTSQNEEENIGIYFYHKAFEEYGTSYFPYGFECDWKKGRIAEEKYSDGSYYFKVKVTVTNAYNAKRKTVASGNVKYVNGSFVVDSFYVS